MGLDLSFLPLFSEDESSYSVLRCSCSQSLSEEIRSLERKHGKPVPASFQSFMCRNLPDDHVGYGPAQRTPYGEPLEMIDVGYLCFLSNHQEVINSSLNRAVWAYLEALPDFTFIALFWH